MRFVSVCTERTIGALTDGVLCYKPLQDHVEIHREVMRDRSFEELSAEFEQETDQGCCGAVSDCVPEDNVGFTAEPGI